MPQPRTDERVLLVTNPASGSSQDVDVRELIDALGGATSVEHLAPALDELQDVLRGAADDVDVVVVAGGDGTLHVAVDALGDDLFGTTLGLIPLGTGNDLARTLGIPEEPIEAARAIVSGIDRSIDVAAAEGAGGARRRFLNASIGGFPVAVDEAVSDRLKRTVGAAAYTLASVKVATDLPRFTVTLDDRVVEDCLAAGVGNGRTVGGGIPMWPTADPGDGLLDGCAVPAGSVADAVKLGLRVRSGTHDDLPEVVAVRAAEIRIDADPEMEMNVDGELIGVRTPVTFTIDGTTTIRVPGTV
jgi:diacylglycerol kinase (ATP)